VHIKKKAFKLCCHLIIFHFQKSKSKIKSFSILIHFLHWLHSFTWIEKIDVQHF